MKVTMVAVCSADGFLTHGDDPLARHWASDEDQAHFLRLVEQHKVIVMGRKTYEAVRPKPQPERLRIVLTRHPEQFMDRQIDGQLEFCSTAPVELIKSLEQQGHDAVLLVGGKVNSELLKAGRVDELWLTIEPVLFGDGVSFGSSTSFTQLELVSSEQLNAKGTLLLHYKIA